MFGPPRLTLTPLGPSHAWGDLRSAYLDALGFPQDYFVELQVQRAQGFRLAVGPAPVGHVLVLDDTAVEFHVDAAWCTHGDHLFAQTVALLGLRRALCKSFDGPWLSACLALQRSAKVVGILFREQRTAPRVVCALEPTIRLAQPADLAAVAAIDEHLFDSPEELEQIVREQHLFLYEHGMDLLGFGVFLPVIPGRIDHDIGMLVNARFRGQGLGKLILQHLAEHCLSRGLRPVAGCEAGNVASRRCLEAVGFLADHRLVEFSL